MSVSSIESKLVQLYSKKIVTIGQPALPFPFIDASTEKQELNSVEINRDKRINRMKGLLYGYYIGAILSTSKEIVVKLNKAREIHNILAAILSSYDHRATVEQRKRLKDLYASFQPEIPFLTKLSAIISDKSHFDAVVSLIRNEYGFIKGEIDVDRIIAQLLTFPIQSTVKNPVIENINNLIRQEESSIIRNANLLPVNDSQVVVIDEKLECLKIQDLSEYDKTLCKVWFNNVLSKDIYNGKISTFKDVLSDDVTIAAKEVCKTDWKGSYPEVTLNALRRHIRGDEFPHVWNNDIYSSMAAVIIRGDDWHKLLQYMQGKEMTDYRLAFAFYGTLNGFANLPRDFTDVLFNQVDRKYIADVYKEIYGQLLGRGVIIPDKSLPEVAVSPQVEKLQFVECDSAFQPSEETSLMSSLKQYETSEEFINFMNIICKKCKGARADEKRYLELYLQNKGLNQDFVDAVSKDKLLNKGKKVQSSILRILQKFIKPEKESKRKSHMVDIESVDLFSDTCQSKGKFLSDYDFLVTNNKFVTLMSNISHEWEKDLRWFIDAHDPLNRNYDYYKDKPTDNKSIIRQFVYFKNKKYRAVEGFLLDLYHVENL